MPSDGNSKNRRLNVHAVEFVPAHEQAFREAYPSLVPPFATSSLSRVKRSSDPLNFRAISFIHPSPAPTPSPVLPLGMVRLTSEETQPYKSSVSIKEPKVKKIRPPSVQLKPTKKRVAQWKAQWKQHEETVAMYSKCLAAPEPSKSVVFSPLEKEEKGNDDLTRNNTSCGRQPGYFIHMAAQSKVYGNPSPDSYEDEYNTGAMKINTAPMQVIAQDESSSMQACNRFDEGVAQRETQIRTEWQVFICSILNHPHTITKENVERMAHFLTKYRSLALWDERCDNKRNVWHLAAAHDHFEVRIVVVYNIYIRFNNYHMRITIHVTTTTCIE
jgi:hypothetical protein